MKNKTIATWLAFLGGPLGMHRFYLYGARDVLGWLLPIPSVLGLYGVWRIQQWGLDDLGSWVLVPLLGFAIAGCALRAIVYGLTTAQRWNASFNAAANLDSPAGRTNWLTIGGVVLSLFVGTIALVSSIVFSFQRMFEYQAL